MIPKGDSMRILFFGMNTAGLIHNLGQGLQELGYQVSTASVTTNPFYNHTFSLSIAPGELVETVTEEEVLPSQAFYDLVNQFDTFIFNTGVSLLPGMSDLPILHRMGKKVIVRNTGSCSRFIYPGSRLWNYAGQLFNMSAEERHELSQPKYNWEKKSSYFNSITYAYHLAPKLYKECMVALYADVVTNSSAHSSLSFSPFFAAINTFDPEGIAPHIPAHIKPIIVHAPSREAFKGTRDILASLEELRAEGLNFELVNPEKIPNRQLKRLLHTADIVIDALGCGGHGMLANEAMASGCAVLGINTPHISPIPFHRPIIPISRENLKEQIRRVVLDMPFRRRVAEAGIEYANVVHRPAAAAGYMMSCLERAQQKTYDYYPTLFLDNPFRPDYQAWIEATSAQLYMPDGEGEPNHRKDMVPPFLQRLFSKALFQAGVHPETNLERFLTFGFTFDTLQAHLIPRWDAARLTRVNPWLSLGEKAGDGLPVQEYISERELLDDDRHIVC